MDHFGDFYAFKQVKGLHSPPQFSASQRLIKASQNALDKTKLFHQEYAAVHRAIDTTETMEGLASTCWEFRGFTYLHYLNLLGFKRGILVLEESIK